MNTHNTFRKYYGMAVITFFRTDYVHDSLLIKMLSRILLFNSNSIYMNKGTDIGCSTSDLEISMACHFNAKL